MQSINDIQDEIIEEFELFDDWEGKFEHIIEFGKELTPLPDDAKTEEHLVKGCQSRVWLTAAEKDGQLQFEADSDAIITKGIVGLLMRMLSGHPAKEIAEAELYAIDKIGLKDHLSPNRANGLASMVKKMKLYAVAHASNKA
jgi:cysteine desulfuration protein SufE